MKADIDAMQFIWQRSSYPVFKKFGVNALELSFLRALYYAQRLEGRGAVAKSQLFKNLSGNRNRWRKYDGCTFGLLKKGLIGSWEYISQPGSITIGLSDLGLAAIRAHDEMIAELLTKYNAGDECVLREMSQGRFRRTA